jgi:hypothetical protein
MKNMPTCISYTVSATEAVWLLLLLLLWNTGNISHTADSHVSKVKPRTEF